MPQGSASPLCQRHYSTLPVNHLDASVQDVAYLYDAYAHDVQNGTCTVSTFTDAVNLHHLIDQVTRSFEAFHQSDGGDASGARHG